MSVMHKITPLHNNNIIIQVKTNLIAHRFLKYIDKQYKCMDCEAVLPSRNDFYHHHRKYHQVNTNIPISDQGQKSFV
jgi:hypothetical protein